MQIYKCKINIFVDKDGNLRSKIDYIRQKRLSDKDEFIECFNQLELDIYLENKMIVFPKNPKHNQLYMLVPIIVDDYYDGFPNGKELKNFVLEEYNK
jgi:hypothetical protein